MPEDLQDPEVQVHHKVQDWILHKDQQVPEASEVQCTEQAADTAEAAGTAADTAEAECTVAVQAAGIAAVRTAGTAGAGCIAVQAADIEAAYTAVVQAAGIAAEQVPEVQELNTVLQEHTALQLH